MAPADELDGQEEGAAGEEEGEDGGETLEVGADGWLDLMEGKIRKRTLKEGNGGNPEMKQDVRCSVEVRLASDVPTSSAEPASADALPRPLQRWPDIRYRMGEGEAVPMLELALRHMKEGEEAEIFGSTNMAWGPSGLKAAGPDEKAIPSGADVNMRVVLIEVLPLAGETPVWNDQIQEVTWRKTNGNNHYKRQDYQKALRCYGAGVKVFSDNGFEVPDHVEEADKPRVRAVALSLVADCSANLAAVHLELGDAVAAKESALAALEFKPEHMKSLYRAAKAHLILDEFDECENMLKKGLGLEADNAALQQVEADLRHKRRQYEAKSKKVAGKVFQGLDYPDVAAEKAKEKAEEEAKLAEEERWWPWAKKAFLDWFQWQVAAILVAGIVLLALLLVALPKKHWPIVLILFVTGVPVVVGLFTGVSSEDEKDQAKAKKRKKA